MSTLPHETTALVHVDSIQTLVEEIKTTRKRLSTLEDELAVRLEKKEEGTARHRADMYPLENNISLVILILATISLFIVMQSGAIMKPDQSASVMTPPISQPLAPLPHEDNCGQFNGNYTACVDGQKRGNGCAWWSDCQRCYDSRLKGADVICKQ